MSALKVIAVHGIWEDPIPTGPDPEPAYIGAFEQRVVAELTRLGVIPPGADAATVAAIVGFDQAWYGDIGDAAQRRTYAHYRAQADRLYNPVDRLLDLALFDRLRRYLIMGASDVLTYESARCREQIRDRVREPIARAIAAGDGAVTLVGHSLGSVICFDIAYYDSYHNADWRRSGFELANLITLGSPLPLFAMSCDERGDPKPKYTDPGAVVKLVRPGGRWLNFFDPQDLFGYPLAATFPGLARDIIVSTGALPTTAHTRMWDNPEVVRHLAACLRDDYRRLAARTKD